MNAFEKQKERILKKLKQRQLMNARAFQSQNSEISEVGEQQYRNAGHDDSTEYHPDEQSEDMEIQYNKKDQLRNNLIAIHQSNTLDTIFQFLNEKLFWLKFFSFNQIQIYSSISSVYHTKNNQILSNLLDKMYKDKSQHEIKRIVLMNFKQTKNHAQLLTNTKAQFFVKYFINASYAKLSFSFSAIKAFAQSQTLMNKVQREKNQIKLIQNEEKLIKFQKQSRKFRAKSVFVIIRNFLNKKYLQSSFNSIRLQLNQQWLQINQENMGSNQESKYQSKDARFIKKKVLPHKIIQQHSFKRSVPENNIFNLNHIYFANHELKSLKKNHVQFIRRINSFFVKKTMCSFDKFYQLLKLNYGQKSKFVNREETRVHKENEDIDMIQNVIKSVCYLSSKIHIKRKNQKDKEKRKNSLFILHHLIVKRQFQNLTAAFYSLKSHGFSQYLNITSRIKELQQRKKKCLEEFCTSVLQTEENNQS